MEQLFCLNDVPPQYRVGNAPPPNSVSPQQQEVDDLYRFHYAQGLDKLFETTWYTSQGPAHVRRDPTLQIFLAQCNDQFKSIDHTHHAAQQSLEARLVWQLALMPRTISQEDAVHGVQANGQTLDLLARIDTLDYLLTGQILPRNKVPPPPSPAMRLDPSSTKERIFWYNLGSFASRHDEDPDPDGEVTEQIDDHLNTLRVLLAGMESRDLLYSLAVMRYFGGRREDFHPERPLVNASVAPPDNSDDENWKLEFARRLVEAQEQKATTQVCQRVAGMGIRGCILQKR